MKLIDHSKTLMKVEQIPLIANKNKSFHDGCRYMQKKVLRLLHESKSVDAEPVVRCKDCMYKDVAYCRDHKTISKTEVYCNFHEIRQSNYGFCSFGYRTTAPTAELDMNEVSK